MKILYNLFLVKKHNFRKDLCMVFIVLTHGNENNILVAADDRYNLFDKIVHPVVKTNKTLLGKPKIFLIQACKGDQEFGRIEKDSVSVTPPSKVLQEVPLADLFVCFATYEGHFSYRDTNSGTPFIQEFCNVLDQSSQSLIMTERHKSINDVMINVTNAVLSKKNM